MINKEALLKLYPDFDVVYGPTWHSSERRYYIFLYKKGTRFRTTLSYAKALMEVRLGRRLTKNEEVDHIDNNKENDDINNLQVLTGIENRNKTKHVKRVKLNCAFCKKEFELLPSQYKTKLKSIRIHGLFCSRSCAAKFQRRVETGVSITS